MVSFQTLRTRSFPYAWIILDFSIWKSCSRYRPLLYTWSNIHLTSHYGRFISSFLFPIWGLEAIATHCWLCGWWLALEFFWFWWFPVGYFVIFSSSGWFWYFLTWLKTGDGIWVSSYSALSGFYCGNLGSLILTVYWYFFRESLLFLKFLSRLLYF